LTLQVRFALLDARPPSGDRAPRRLLERSVEGFDLAARPTEPLLEGPDRAVHLGVDVGLLVVRVLQRQHDLVAVDARPRRAVCELVRAQPEDARVAGERDAYHDSVARNAAVGCVGTEVATRVVRDIDLDLFCRLPIHLIHLEFGHFDLELLGERSRPLVGVGLQKVLFGHRLDQRRASAPPGSRARRAARRP